MGFEPTRIKQGSLSPSCTASFITARLKERIAHSSDLSRRDVIIFPLSATFYFKIRLSTFTLCSCGAPANYRSFSTRSRIRTDTYYLRQRFELCASTQFRHSCILSGDQNEILPFRLTRIHSSALDLL